MKMEVDVLSDTLNLSVIKMPERRYPGILVQGDALINMTSHADRAYKRAQKLGDQDLICATGNVLAKLEEYLEHYSKTCRANKV